MPTPPAVPRAADRLVVVDALRGIAVVAMIAYHACFDLTWFGWAHWPMLDDPRWIAARSAIVTSFLLVTGLSLALRDRRERGTPAAAYASRGFVRRWLQVAAGALLVSAGSALLFPDSLIYFGVLHFTAVAWWLCRRAPRLGWTSVALGIVVIAAGRLGFDAMDPKAIDWIGFAAHKPITEDYVPLVPWLGVVLVGCGLGARWGRADWALAAPLARAWAAIPTGVRATLAFAGRRSLTIYLVHQPLLMGAMALVARLVRNS